ncbi:hypothetical protein T4D_5520 [Trichinella pseudospiralis]|uniref:Uncharacterized protein n=1 Tax=Trichinella pseudospiralis TaxID=6337 RepID=A0A0V1FL36_TRIPS|nr:hypothetical protein T4D_5520 [Trichinella pseudospiralis]
MSFATLIVCYLGRKVTSDCGDRIECCLLESASTVNDGNKFYSLCLCNEEPFTLDFDKPYLLHPTCLYLPEFDQRTQLTNERNCPTNDSIQPSRSMLLAFSTFLLSSPCVLRFITGLRICVCNASCVRYPYPRLTELGPLGNRIYRMSSSTVLLRVVLDLLHAVRDLLRVVRVFTFSFLHYPYL